MKKLFISILIGMMAINGTVYGADSTQDSVEFTERVLDDGSVVYEFDEVAVTLPADWAGKYDMEVKGNSVTFYHKTSREKWIEKNGTSGGNLFTLSCSVNHDFTKLPDFAYIGFSEESMMNYFLIFPTDFQAYVDDSTVAEEFQELYSGLDFVKEHTYIIEREGDQSSLSVGDREKDEVIRTSDLEAGLTSFSEAGIPVSDAYKVTEVEDPEMGMTIARCYAPVDYSVSGEAFWCGKWQSISAPAQVYVTACSADGNTVMGFYSLVCYEQILDYSVNGILCKEHQDGMFDVESLIPMLAFMDADMYCDYMAGIILPDQNLQLKGQAEVTDEEQSVMDEKANEIYQQSLPFMSEMGFQIDGAYFGVAERTYSVELDGSDFLLTVCAATDGIQFSSSKDFVYNMGTMTTCMVSWESPFVFFMVTPESEHEKNYLAYEQFVLNTAISDQFTAAFTQAQTEITQKMLQIGGSSMDAVSDYCKSSISSSMGSDSSYSDERFTDYIFSQNDYTMSNGDHVKVSTSYDYVYEDESGNIYVSNSTEQPAGTTRLYAN